MDVASWNLIYRSPAHLSQAILISFSIALNSMSPVTSSALSCFASAAAKCFPLAFVAFVPGPFLGQRLVAGFAFEQAKAALNGGSRHRLQ